MQAILAFVLFASPSAQAASDQLPAMVARSIRQLDDDAFAVRQRATELLWSLGPAVVPALERLRESPHAEVRLRVESILERFRYGIFAHTPEPEVGLINRFRWGDQSARDLAFRRLTEQGSIGTLLTLLETVTEDKQRFKYQQSILRRLEQDAEIGRALSLAEEWLAEYTADETRRRSLKQFMRRQLPYLLATQRVAQAELILRQTAVEDGRDWAVYQMLTGNTAAVLDELREKAAPTEEEVRKLVYLFRAQGDLAAARSAALKLEDGFSPLARGLLFELRDWHALSDLFHEHAADGEYRRNAEFFGYAAAFHRLAGQTERFDQTVRSLKSLARTRPALVWSCGEALIVNGLVDEGIELLKERYTAYAFQLLCVQDRFSQAFGLAGIEEPRGELSEWFADVARRSGSRSSDSSRHFDLALQVAKVLAQLGEREAARGYLRTLAEGVQYERDARRLDRVCEIEIRLGFTDQAYRHAAISLEKGRTAILAKLFPSFSREAVFWQRFFAKSRERKSPAKTLADVRQLATPGSQDPEEFRRLVERAEEFARQQQPSARGTGLHAIGETCWKHSESQRGEELLVEAADTVPAAALSLAERAWKDEQWLSAAAWYEKAWQQDRAHALALYLRGQALVRAGQPEEGQRLMSSAELIPLADSGRRMDLARGLKRFGFDAQAQAQWQLIMRSGRLRVGLDTKFRDTAVVDAQKLFGNTFGNDPYEKAAHWESMHLSCLEMQLWIPSMRGYFYTPHLFGKTRARAYLAAGQLDQARAEIERCRELLPGNTELAEHLVPELEKRGESAAADELFEKSYAFIASICRQFPQSALHHNNLAWMSARCNRRLDEALRHAQRALELVPDSPSYLDTLGEVHFRRGEIQPAIACAQKCLRLEPQNDFFHAQLKRFQQAAN